MYQEISRNDRKNRICRSCAHYIILCMVSVLSWTNLIRMKTARRRLNEQLRQHMTDRSHCKLLYDEDEDLHEYESFYDFSASYSVAAAAAAPSETVGLASENACCHSAPCDAGVPEGRNRGSSDGEEVVEVSRTLGVTDLDELVLLDGKTVGNRKWGRCVWGHELGARGMQSFLCFFVWNRRLDI